MNIVMMTNTYLPHVGGVANSVSRFAEGYRERGHRVLIVAPSYEGQPEDEDDVVRVTTIQNFNGSDFSVAVPTPFEMKARLDEFRPDVVHSHHPFLIGDAALRVAAGRAVPLVFTHHTMYEDYTHYVPMKADGMRRFVIELCTGYCNLCDRVIAPSESVQRILEDRGVVTPIRVIPTGVNTATFADGDGEAFRRRHELPDDAMVVGHVGRLAKEKNLEFMAEAVAQFMVSGEGRHALMVGEGPAREAVERIMRERDVGDRLLCTGALSGQDLVDAYHAMDVFAFASKSETQGMVLVEALAAGVPVVALDAPGAREVVQDGENGRLLKREDAGEFARALEWVDAMDEAEYGRLVERSRKSAGPFAIERCVERALDLYEEAIGEGRSAAAEDVDGFDAILEALRMEWEIWANRLASLSEAAADEGIPPPPLAE